MLHRCTLLQEKQPKYTIPTWYSNRLYYDGIYVHRNFFHITVPAPVYPVLLNGTKLHNATVFHFAQCFIRGNRGQVPGCQLIGQGQGAGCMAACNRRQFPSDELNNPSTRLVSLKLASRVKLVDLNSIDASNSQCDTIRCGARANILSSGFFRLYRVEAMSFQNGIFYLTGLTA